MSFIDLSMLKRVAHESVKVDSVEEKIEPHPMLSQGEVPYETRTLYLQGCVLAAMLNNGDIDAKSKAKLVRLGESLELELKDVYDCILSTARLGEDDQGKEELVRKLIKDLSGDFYPKFFIKDFEDNLLKVGGELTVEMSEYLDYFGQALFGSKDWKLVDELRTAFENKDYAAFMSLITKFPVANGEMCALAGKCYFDGLGVEKDYCQGVEWFERAAEKGDVKSQFRLGVIYESGSWVEKNFELSIKWYRRAAEQGDVKSQIRLGKIFRFGDCDAEVDCEQAKVWLEKASAQGGVDAAQWMENIDFCIEEYKECVAWFAKSAEQGSLASAYHCAWRYWNGEGCRDEYLQAVNVIRDAAEKGDSLAEYALAKMYEYGKGVKRNEDQQNKWMLESAQNGYAKAQDEIASHYYLEEDHEKSLMWYRKLAENGDARAMLRIAYCYRAGHGVDVSMEKAMAWYRKAAECGVAEAMRELSSIYEEGDGVEKDYAEALCWHRKAVDAGNSYSHGHVSFYGECVDWFAGQSGQGSVPQETYRRVSEYWQKKCDEKSYTAAIGKIVEAANNGDSVAEYAMGLLSYFGIGVSRYRLESMDWIFRSAEHGYAQAQEHVAICYSDNDMDLYLAAYVENCSPVPDELSKFRLNQLYAYQDQDADAMQELGVAYCKGACVKQDSEQGRYWLQKSIECGNDKAREALKDLLGE